MKRREFSQTLAATGAMLGVAGTSSVALAQGTVSLTEGRDYRKIAPAVPTAAPKGKVEVLEFFGYWCPHCNSLEPRLEAWLKTAPKNIAFQRVPVFFGAQTQPFQKLYYALEAMGQINAMHKKVFYAFHVEKRALNNDRAIIDWAVSQGLNRAKFTETYNSFGVSNKAKRAAQLTTAYQVEGVPSMAVHGQFMVPNGARIFQVVQALAAQVRA